MKYKNLNLIVAYDDNRLIGKNNNLPWSSKEDLKYFRTQTLNNTVIMGRKTYDSLPVQLKNRKVIVITKDINYVPKHEGTIVLNSIEDVHKYIQTNVEEKIFIIGGSTIYEIFLPYIYRFYITEVKGEFVGDSYFPNWLTSEYTLIQSDNKIDTNLELKFDIYEHIS